MTKQNDNEDMTIDELARMVNEGFEDVGEQLGKLSAEITGVKGELYSAEERLTRRIAGLENRVIGEHGKDLEALNTSRDAHEKRLSDVESRVDHLEADATGTPRAT